MCKLRKCNILCEELPIIAAKSADGKNEMAELYAAAKKNLKIWLIRVLKNELYFFILYEKKNSVRKINTERNSLFLCESNVNYWSFFNSYPKPSSVYPSRAQVSEIPFQVSREGAELTKPLRRFGL